jgi:hypothetical protein
MVYFLGRDVSVYIGTETVQAGKNIGVLSGSVAGTTVVSIAADGTTNYDAFAYSMQEGATVSDWPAAVSDVTGVDVGIGATDEDITYIGQKGTGKVPIKSEYTISLTRKKKNNTWDMIFNGPVLAASAEDGAGKHAARWGLAGDYGNSTEAAPLIADGLANPKDYSTSANVEAGYRMFIVFKSGSSGETMAFPNCLITSHSVSVNADGTSEETLELMTQQTALMGSDGDTFNIGRTTLAEY